MADKYNFSTWLSEQMDKRNLTQAELARLAGVTRSAINGVLTGTRGPGNDLCLAIARALRLPPETVFRAAGLLPPEPEYVPLLDEWNAVFYELTPDEQQELIDIARLKVDRRKSPGQQSNQKSPSRSKRPARSVHG